MKILVLSDVHANLVALEAVLTAAPAVDAVWNLGDTVGYGPRPGACLTRMEQLLPDVTLMGNHDLAAVGGLDLADFNPWARQAAIWTRAQLSQEQQAFLASLPAKTVRNGVTLAHGSPRAPIWEYVTDRAIAASSFAHFETKLCLVGHTHTPMVAFRLPSPNRVETAPFHDGQTVDLAAGRFLINPGSVGQPRDGDPRASFAILDLAVNVITNRRVHYDIRETQRQMIAAGLPRLLIDRLRLGL